MDVALASCVSLPEPDPDQAPLAAALEAAGLRTTVLAWDDPTADFGSARMTLLRATWNYFERPSEFLEWAERTSSVSDLWNPLEIVRWNHHKRYLLELETAGIPIAPTELIERGSERALSEVMAQRDWRRVVIKPAISASSFQTMLASDSADGFDGGEKTLPAGEKHLRALATDRDVLVQAYLPSVESYGERSLVWIDGVLSHAVRKTPRFSGQSEAVSKSDVGISEDEAEVANRAMDFARARFAKPPMYARIDLAPGAEGHSVVMELELIEPSLFFSQSGTSLSRFVNAVQRRLSI